MNINELLKNGPLSRLVSVLLEREYMAAVSQHAPDHFVVQYCDSHFHDYPAIEIVGGAIKMPAGSPIELMEAIIGF